MSTERAVSTDLAEAISDAIREAILDLMSCGDEVRDMVGEALLDHLGGEEVRKEVDRHVREAVQSNQVASNEFRAMEARLNDQLKLLQIQDGQIDEIEKAMEVDRLDHRNRADYLGNAIVAHGRRLEFLEVTLERFKALIDAEVEARRRDYAELNRLVHALEGGLATLSAGLLMLQGDEMRRQATPWRRLVRYLRGLGRKGAGE